MTVAGQLVIRERVDEEPAECRHERSRRCETEREDSYEVVPGSRKFGRRNLRLADAAQLRKDLRNGGHGGSRLDRRPDRERTGPAAHVVSGTDAVCVALLLAQVHLEPRVEETAQDCGHDLNGVEVRRATRQADVAAPDLRLNRARTVVE